MKIITLSLMLLLSLALVNTSSAKDFPDMESLMSEQEFAATGLNKLTAEERKALNAWLLKYTTDDVPKLVKEVPELERAVALKQALKPDPEKPIVSRITGKIKGWTGKTVFTLDNGQVWKQRHSGRYYRKMENPEVRISKNFMGFYMLEIVETGKKVGVKRIR